VSCRRRRLPPLRLPCSPILRWLTWLGPGGLPLLVLACATSGDLFQDAEKAWRGGETVRAESLYRKVLAEQPEHAAARQRLADLLVEEGRELWLRDDSPASARPLLAEALTWHPASLPAQLFAVELDGAEELVLPQERVTRLQELVATHPQSAAARLLLGRALLEVGEAPAAIEQLHQGSRLAPADLRLQVLLAEAISPSNPEEAARRLARLRDAYPGNVPLLLEIASLLQRQERFDEAAQVLGDAAGKAPGNHEVQAAQRRLERTRRERDVELDSPGGER